MPINDGGWEEDVIQSRQSQDFSNHTWMQLHAMLTVIFGLNWYQQT